MLACMLGKNREIFFPKLDEEQMMTFDSIAKDLLKSNGYKVLECSSDEEAIDRADDLRKGSNLYPVHFSKSNTSGEKAYEEFYTDSEEIDNDRFKALGVVTGKSIPQKDRLNELLLELENSFKRDDIEKIEIVNIIKKYLPNFEHIETGKSLDSKM